MSNVRTRIGGLLAIGCVVALMVAGATPAFAHHKEDHTQGQEEPASEAERFDESDDTSADDTSSDGGSSDYGKSNTDSQGTTTTTSSSDDGSPDGAGKNYDREGEPRGETDTSCPNDKSGASDPRQVYDNTCDGRAGKAGSGGGSGGGGACAGCVGNADDKNPSGQMSDGDHDGNAGYECDGNNGVARDNPAHTGCPEPATPTSTPMCPSNPSLPLDHPNCGVLGGTPSGPRVLPNVIRRLAQPRAERVQAGAVLPFTGAANVLTLLMTGLALIGSGTLAMRTRRTK